jgi:hypothetical protein
MERAVLPLPLGAVLVPPRVTHPHRAGKVAAVARPITACGE